MTSDLVLEAFLPYRLNVLAADMSGRLGNIYGKSFGISIPEWRVLAHLSQASKISVREVHEKVGMDKAKVSRAAARLEAAGYLEKRASAVDARLVELSLTKKGRRLFADIAPLALAYEANILAALTDAERAALDAIISKVQGVLDCSR